MSDVTSPIDEPDNDSLSTSDCWALLRDQPYGRLAVIGDDGPEIFPINALVDHGSIVFRTGAGAKLAALDADPRVAFEVDGYDSSTREVWSVVVRGDALRITGLHERLDVAELGVTPWQQGAKPAFLRIEPISITGRRFGRADRAEWSVPVVQHTTSID